VSVQEVEEPLQEQPGGEGPAKRGLKSRGLLQQFSLLGAWAAVIICFGVLKPDQYFTLGNFSSIFGSNAVLAVLALGLIIVLRAGDFDLSVASTMTFSGVLLAVLTVHQNIPLVAAIMLTLLSGALIGAVNAFIVLVLNVDSFITTLGVATLLQGLTLWVSNNQTITGIPESLINAVVVYRVGSIPLEFYYALALMLVLWYLFRYTSVGRRLLFVGKNREVSRLSGLRVGRVRLGAFVSGALVASFAGVLYSGTSGSADPTSGLSYLLPAFAAAFLGATCIEVGEFNPIGTLVAVYFLVSGISGLAVIGVPSFVQQLFYGGALIVAVAGSELVSRSKSTRRRGRAA